MAIMQNNPLPSLSHSTVVLNEKFFKLQSGAIGCKSKGDKIGMDYTHGAVGLSDRITSQA